MPLWSKRLIWLLWFMDVSVTEANQNNAFFKWGLNLAQLSVPIFHSYLASADLANPILKVFLLSTDSERLNRSDVKYFDLIFFAELRSSQYLLLCWCSSSHKTTCEHFTFPGSIICANFSFTFVNLALANILEEGCTILASGCKMPKNNKTQYFQYSTIMPMSEIYSAFVAV